MGQNPRKTERMARSKELQSLRKTERMGIARDTVRDVAPVAASKNRGTIPMAHAPRKGPSSDRVEGGEVRIGSGSLPGDVPEERTDLSKLGGRFAKTVKVARRPAEIQAPGFADDLEEVAPRRVRSRTRTWVMVGTLVVGVLAVTAVALLLLIARQRGLL
jgi:hypothetical protein